MQTQKNPTTFNPARPGRRSFPTISGIATTSAFRMREGMSSQLDINSSGISAPVPGGVGRFLWRGNPDLDPADQALHVFVEIRVGADRIPWRKDSPRKLSGSSSAGGTEELPTRTGMTGIFRTRAASISILTKSPGSSSRRVPPFPAAENHAPR